MPHTKLALFSLLYVFLITFAVLFIAKDGEKLTEAFAFLFLSTSLISVLMESRLLIRQTKTIAHLFSGVDHRQLRNKILFSLDKNFLINSIVFVIGLLVMTQIFSIPLDIFKLFIFSVTIIVTALAYYPFLLCFQWINITFSLVLAVCLYAAMIFIAARWVTIGLQTPYIVYYLLVLIGVAVLLRTVTQIIFWRKPFEILLKNK
jgi:hypothetical protein